MQNSAHKYLIDADVFIRIRERSDSEAIYSGILVLASAGRLKSVRQALDEVKKFDAVHERLKEHRETLQISTEEQYSAAVQDRIEYLGKNADYLWTQTGGKNPDPADPWLVAVSCALGYTLVTNENPRRLKRIPAACLLPGTTCRCIRGPHFLVETGLVTEIKPEHIDPEGFFKA